MLSFFRKGSSSSSSTERTPPPSAQARRDKEQRWFSSLKPSTSSSSNQNAAHPTFSTTKTAPPSSADSLHHSPRSLQVNEGRNAGSGASLRTRGSRLFQLGGSTQNQPERYKHASEPSSTPTGYAASAPNPNARGGRTSPPPPLPNNPVPSPAPTSTTTDPNTKSLATRLQELSTSHADGLLDDEEYRLLRTELFERYAAKSSQPAQPLNQPSFATLERQPNASTPALAPPIAPSPASPPQPTKAVARAPSFISTNSRDTRRSSVSGLRSLFRRSSHATLRPDGDDPDTWEVVDPNSPSTSPAPRSPSAVSQAHSPDLATRTVRHHPALASASLSPSMSYRSSRSSNGYGYSTRAGSSVRSGGSGRSGAGSRAGTSLSMSNGPTLLPPMASSRDPFLLAAAEREPTSKELREEIAEIERERQRLEDSWKSLEKAAVARAGGVNGVVAEPTIQVRPPTADGGAGSKRMSALLRKTSFTRRPLSQVVESPHIPSTPPRSPGQSSSPVLRPGSRLSTYQPSPHARPGDHSPGRQTSPRAASGSFASPASSRLLASGSRDGEEDEVAEGAGLGVEEVRRRRRATDERYEKRLEYLRARLRGALLREGLKG